MNEYTKRFIDNQWDSSLMCYVDTVAKGNIVNSYIYFGQLVILDSILNLERLGPKYEGKLLDYLNELVSEEVDKRYKELNK